MSFERLFLHWLVLPKSLSISLKKGDLLISLERLNSSPMVYKSVIMYTNEYPSMSYSSVSDNHYVKDYYHFPVLIIPTTS